MSKKVRIPTFSYPGAKARLARRICALLPSKGKRFVDPFSGRGNLVWAAMSLLDYQSYWINDIQTFSFFRQIKLSHIYAVPERTRNDPKSLKQSYNRMKEYNRGRVFPDGRKLPKKFPPSAMLEPLLTFSGGTYSTAGFRGGGGGVSSAGFREKLDAARELMKTHETRITRLDYKEVLRQCTEEDVCFIDPPYLGASVKAYSDKTLNHQELVDILLNAKFRWMLTEYEHPIYKPLTEKFGEPIRIRVHKSMNNANERKAKRWATECIWRNYPTQ
jgi:site-specific DNA-adenine methylase